eukprot:6482888-Amphidinium_carterae.1
MFTPYFEALVDVFADVDLKPFVSSVVQYIVGSNGLGLFGDCNSEGVPASPPLESGDVVSAVEPESWPEQDQSCTGSYYYSYYYYAYYY